MNCADCSSSRSFPYLREEGNPIAGHVWLCGSCRLKREKPGIAETVKGSMRRAHLESLFPLPPRVSRDERGR